MAPSTTIALIGYRATGKSTVAQQLAKRLGFDWVDSDAEVELQAGKSVSAIFEESGEEAFRDLEAEIVAKLCQRERTVVALGGGAVLRESSRDSLAGCLAVVWLQASAETIARRLASDPATAARRPNLTNHGGRTEIKQLLEEREAIYRACATLEVDTEDRDPAEIADEIAEAIRF